MVCGKSIQIVRSNWTNQYYVLYRDAHAWRKTHKSGFDTYQVALDYAISRSVATIRFNAQLSPLS